MRILSQGSLLAFDELIESLRQCAAAYPGEAISLRSNAIRHEGEVWLDVDNLIRRIRALGERAFGCWGHIVVQ